MSLGGYAADALPLLGCWLAAAWRTGRFVPTWLLGVTAGVVLRMVILGHERWSELAFWLVALVFIGVVAALLTVVLKRPHREVASSGG